MRSRRLGHVLALNGLRGIAIAAVVASHLFGLRGGFFGVDLFFVLSGFLITTLLLEERDRDGRVSLRGFYARRARRLFPAVGVLLLAVTVTASVGNIEQGAKLAAQGGLYIANIIRAFARPDPLTSTPVDHLWSLAQEEQFYLAWPVILVMLFRRCIDERRLAAGLTAVFMLLVCYRAGLIFAGAGWHRVYFGPDTHADGLVLGCLAALIRRRGIRISGAATAGAFALLVACLVLGDQTDAWSVYGLPVVEIASALLVLGALESGPVTRLLSLRPLVLLGVISYSLYLWHRYAAWAVPGNGPWLPLLLSVLLAVASYRYIEQPFRRRRISVERAYRS